MKEKDMINKRIINRFLGFILAMTLIIGVMPPITINAAAPNITTEAAYDIEMYEATVSAYIKTNGGNLFKEHGFYYGTTSSCKTKVVVDDNGGSGTSLDTPDRYTYTFDDLDMGTKYYYKAYVLTTSGTYYYGGVGSFTTEMLEYDIDVDTIDTDGEQTMNTLEMLAELYVDVNYGKAGSVLVGFEFGVKGGTQKKTTATRGYYDGDEFGWTLTGLQPGTSYTYRGFAIDPITNEYIYGNRVTITTLDEEDFLPEVYTESATDITLTSAVINGDLDYTADLTTEFGFILGTGVTEQVKIGSSSKTKSFSYDWEYLQPNTKYTYKTYAKNKYGTVYGEVKTFYTKSDTTKPVIELLKSSLGNEFEQGSTVTFYAEASDNVALSEFILYVDNVEVDYSDYWTDYEELEYSTSKLSVGSHTIKAYAVDDAGNEATKSIVVKVLAPAEPSITNISPSKNTVPVGTKISFNITANNSVSGVQLYVKENGNTYDLGRTTLVESQTTTSKKFIIDYTFNSTGLFDGNSYATNTRRVYAYPIDSNGTIIDNNAASSYCDITVTPATYTLGSFTVYDTEVQLGNNAIISWSASSAQTNDSVYYNVYIGTKSRTILLTPNKTTSRSVTVDSSLIKELGTGTYAIMVIATAANHSQKQANANITITTSTIFADTTKPMINPITSSVDPIVYGSSVTFTTAASDETALDRVEMYVDGTLVKKVSAGDKYANISYTTDSLSIGNHTILVKAFDDAGNYNSWSQLFTVKTISAGIVYDVDLSDYDFYAGSYVTFTVKTSKDTTKIRLVDGSYTFSVQSKGYKDSGNYRIWSFEQYVGTVGTNRRLKVESYSGGWTGNYYTTEPFTVRKNIVDVGDFEILSPSSSDKHQVNTSLTVTWTTPDIKPDWYVVNVSGVPSGSDLISINGNSAVINGSAFNEYGTYVITVTAQKSGYNQSEAYVNITVGCMHEDRELVGKKYGSEVYYNASKHSVTVIPQYSCNTCGGTFTSNEDATTEYFSHNHDVELDNNGWLCDCGYVETGSFNTWNGYLQSYENEKAYSRVLPDGALTNWDGISKIYPQDDITVLGTKYNAWLVRYNVGSNKTKVRFIARELVDAQPYTGIDIQYITINGSSIKCIYSSQQRVTTPTYYADFYSLMQALNAQPVYVQNNHYYCQATPRDYVNGRYIYMSVDLSNYKVNNWQNVYAYTTDYNKDVIPGFCVGSYVYSGNIFIELEELMDLLSYTRLPDGSYVQPNDPRDYSAISIASQILGKSQEFDLTYDSLVNKYVGTALSDIYYGVTLQWNELEKKKINSDPDIEIIASIKESLVQAMGSLPAAQQKEADEFLKFMTDTLPDVFEYGDKATIELMFTTNFKNLTDFENHILLSQILGELGEVFKGVGLAFDIHEFWISCENLGSVTATEIYIMYCLAQNYDYNKAILANLINNAATDEMKAIYRKVDRELELYYNNLMLGILQTGATNPEIREKAVDTIAAALNVAGFSSGAVFGKINIYAAVYAAVSSYVDAALGGTKVYNAQDKIYTFKESLDLLTPDLEKAITTYQNSPTPENKQNMINYAIIVGNLRCKSIDACIEFIYSQYIRNAFDYYFNDSNALWNRHSSLLDEQESIQRYMTQLGGK